MSVRIDTNCADCTGQGFEVAVDETILGNAAYPRADAGANEINLAPFHDIHIGLWITERQSTYDHIPRFPPPPADDRESSRPPSSPLCTEISSHEQNGISLEPSPMELTAWNIAAFCPFMILAFHPGGGPEVKFVPLFHPICTYSHFRAKCLLDSVFLGRPQIYVLRNSIPILPFGNC